MANPTTNYGWQMPTPTDLVTDLPADFEVFGQAVDTSLLGLKGGTTGQVLSKTSGTDMAFTWVEQDDSNAIQVAIVDAKGDLIAATAADAVARLPVGTNAQVLTADSAEATGMKWAAAGGKVLQVVMGTQATAVTITTTTMTDSGLTATITPTLNTSKVLVLIAQMYYTYKTGSGNAATANYRILRGATVILDNSNAFAYGAEAGNSAIEAAGTLSVSYLDSPATTSATTYKLQGRVYFAQDLTFQRSSNTSTIILLEIGA